MFRPLPAARAAAGQPPVHVHVRQVREETPTGRRRSAAQRGQRAEKLAAKNAGAQETAGLYQQ